jgi:hypothetical protein
MPSNPRFVLFKGSRHGLGNKLYTLSTCITLCRRWKAKLLIDWQSDEDSKVVFEDLFRLVDCDEILADLRPEDLAGMTTRQTAWTSKFHWPTKRICNEEARASNYQGHDITQEPALSGIKQALAGAPQGEVLVACGFTQEGTSERCLLRHLRLAKPVAAYVKHRISMMPLEIRTGEYAGLHVRAAAQSVFAQVDYGRIRKALARRGCQHVLVSTDLAAEQLRAEQELGAKAIFLDKSYPSTATGRNSLEPMALHKAVYREAGLDELGVNYEALCEMYLLSASKLLFFHPGSTFSKIAVLFHGGPPWRCVPNSNTSIRTLIGGAFRSSLKYTVYKTDRRPRLIACRNNE